MLDSMLMAFSLYSRIPVPQAKWNDESMRWCICFLPLVGLVIGAAQWAAFALLTHFSFGPVLRGGSREKRLEILKDPHVGAFAVIGGIVYFVLDFGIWSEAGKQEIPLLCLIFVLSRALSAFAAVTFPKAKKDGMLRQETDPAARGTAAAMSVTSLAVCVLMIVLNVTFSAAETASAAFLFPLAAVCAAAASLAVFFYYRHMAIKNFGGTTGDISGWFTQTCELVTAAAVIAAFRCL